MRRSQNAINVFVAVSNAAAIGWISDLRRQESQKRTAPLSEILVGQASIRFGRGLPVKALRILMEII